MAGFCRLRERRVLLFRWYSIGMCLWLLLRFWSEGKLIRSVSFVVLFLSLYLNLQGIWTGMICGTLMQTIILIWVTWTTDWTKEVSIPKTQNIHIYICRF